MKVQIESFQLLTPTCSINYSLWRLSRVLRSHRRRASNSLNISGIKDHIMARGRRINNIIITRHKANGDILQTCNKYPLASYKTTIICGSTKERSIMKRMGGEMLSSNSCLRLEEWLNWTFIAIESVFKIYSSALPTDICSSGMPINLATFVYLPIRSLSWGELLWPSDTLPLATATRDDD